MARFGSSALPLGRCLASLATACAALVDAFAQWLRLMLATVCRQTGSPGKPCTVGTVTSEDRESTQWKIYGERLIDENPFIRLSIASVELPDGTEFEQYVMRMRRTATTVVVDDQDRVLLMWRPVHRRPVGVGAAWRLCGSGRGFCS